jgi:nicotinamidase-related amidase
MKLDPKTTALVLIDLQQGIVARETKPHASKDVVARAARLADAFRGAGATVVLVNVAYASDDGDRLQTPVDSPAPLANLPPEWSTLVPELGAQPGDLRVTKHQWGAFYGTDLDLQLRRRGIRTIVLGGISTNFGVESTARDGWERNYAVVFAEDAMAGVSAEAHQFAISTIFPRIGRVRSTDQILLSFPKN